MQAEVNYSQHNYSLPYHPAYCPPAYRSPAYRPPVQPRITQADYEEWSHARVEAHPPRGTIIAFPRQGKILVQGGIKPAVEEQIPSLRIPDRPSRRLLAFTTAITLTGFALLVTSSPHTLPEASLSQPMLSQEVEVPSLSKPSTPPLIPDISEAPLKEISLHPAPPGAERPALKVTLPTPYQPRVSEGGEIAQSFEAIEPGTPSFELRTAYQNLVDEDGWQVSDPRFGIAAHWRSGAWSAEASYLPTRLGPADLRTYEEDAFVNNTSAFVRAEGKDGRFRAYAIRQETLSDEWYRDDLIGSDGTMKISPSLQSWYKVGHLDWGEQSKTVLGGDVGVLLGKSDPGEVKLVAGRSRNTTWSDAGSVLLDSYTRSDFRRSPYAETGVTHHAYYPMQFQPWSESMERTTAGVGVRLSPYSSGGLLYQATTSKDQVPSSKRSDGVARTTETRTHGVQLVWRYNPSDSLSLDIDSSVGMDEAKGDLETKQSFSLKFRF